MLAAPTTATGLRAFSSSAAQTTTVTGARTLLRPYSSSFSSCTLGLRPSAPATPAHKILLPIAYNSPSSSSNPAIPYPLTGIRSASTTAGTPSGRGGEGAAPGTEQPLDWSKFFELRKSRRRWQLTFSILASISSGAVGAMLLANGVGESVLGTLPLDPFVSVGLATSAFAVMGWLLGPVAGNTIFYWINRQWRRQMTAKEVEFFARIKKNRVDPTASSAGNPVPDFYGEKIQSVAGYRQWLKDQRAFNKKRTTFV